MDSLKVISDINNRLTDLDEKISKTSKSSAVAFSYLYSRINDINNHDGKINDINNVVSYVSNDITAVKISASSYYTALKDNITDISNNVYAISIKNDETITGINDRVKKLENAIDEINKKLDNIIDCPYKYIIVKKEPALIIKIFTSIHDALYKVFHFKQIKQERERIAEMERQKAEEEKRKAEAAEKQRLLKEQQEREAKRKQIHNLLK